MKAEALSEPVLVGRAKELKELQHCLASAAKGKGNTVFVSGEAGSGKTRLVNEFLKAAKQKTEFTMLTGSCLSNAAAPYLPFVEAFSSYFSEKESQQTENAVAEINAWLSGAKQAEKSREYGNLGPQGWKDLTFAAVTKTLSVISEAKPLILFIEDLHWADSASLSLLHFVARAMRSKKVLLLATFRSEELTTDAEGQVHPLTEELRMMNREGLFTEIKLPNLNQASVSEIAENMMGGKINPEFTARLSQESRGNALFVVESLRMLSERGNLYLENGEWRLTVDTLGLPDKFKDVILRRLSLLKFNHRRVLDAASVIGEKFDVELLAVVLGQDSLEVLEALNTIARSTSLVSVEENFFRFDHAKSRQAIYEEIPVPLKRGYHRRVAEKLESTSTRGRLSFSEIAYHYSEAGNTEKAVKFALDAGQDTLARFSNAEAVKHFAYVLQTIPDSTENSALKSTALEGSGDAYYANGRYLKALEAFERLASFEIGETRLRAYRKAMDAVNFGPIGKEYMLKLAMQAEPYSACDRLEYARIRFRKSIALKYDAGREEELSAALQVFEEEYSFHDIAKALSLRALTDVYRGSSKKGLSDSQRATAMQRELHGDSEELALTILSSGQVFMNAGLFQETWAQLAEALRIGEKVFDYHRSANTCVVMSRFLEAQGKIEEALSMSLKALKYYEKTDAQRRQDRIWADLVRQYTKLGDLSCAEEFMKQLSCTPITLDFIDPEGLLNRRDSLRSQAVFFAATNRWKQAYEYLEEALGLAKKIPMYPIFSKILVREDYAWVLNREGRTEEAQMHLDEVQRLYDEVDRNFVHVEIDANLLAPKSIVAGEGFEIRLDLVNVSRKTGLLAKVEAFVPVEFAVVGSPLSCTIEDGSVDLKKRKIGPFEVETIKLKLKASEPDTYTLNPQVTYFDESGETKTCKTNEVTITVKPAQPKFEILPGRITTGFEDLDGLLFGGIPENYAVALTAPSTDEKELIVKRFLEAGATAGETTFHVTAEAGSVKSSAGKYPSSFFLFFCNPQADAMIQDQPNVFKLNGIENLTDIDIALTKAFRTLKPSAVGTKRICLEIVSDVLLQHHAINTRRWLSALLPTLKLKGFTILAVVDPSMHPSEELQAVLGLFDGEIRVTEKETPEGAKQTLKIRKLINQRYSDVEIFLNKEA